VIIPGLSYYRRDFVHIDDLVAAILELLGAGSVFPDLVNVASGNSVSLSDTAALIGRLSGAPLDIDYEQPRAGTIVATHGAVTRFSDLLGRNPICLPEGLISTLDWLAQSGTAT
jgi:nucleoside-diphosphate-sugar epimerase